jgi:hypothetical protein
MSLSVSPDRPNRTPAALTPLMLARGPTVRDLGPYVVAVGIDHAERNSSVIQEDARARRHGLGEIRRAHRDAFRITREVTRGEPKRRTCCERDGLASPQSADADLSCMIATGRPAGSSPVRTHDHICRCVSREPWEKLMRNTSTPAALSASTCS